MKIRRNRSGKAILVITLIIVLVVVLSLIGAVGGFDSETGNKFPIGTVDSIVEDFNDNGDRIYSLTLHAGKVTETYQVTETAKKKLEVGHVYKFYVDKYGIIQDSAERPEK
jgi:major membrane immunogen (membrane-anchored lipoprotein)